jgi:hypothetical protein
MLCKKNWEELILSQSEISTLQWKHMVTSPIKLIKIMANYGKLEIHLVSLIMHILDNAVQQNI